MTVFTLAVLTGIFLPREWVHGTLTRWLVAWNVGTCLYVIVAALMMSRSTPQHMRRRAQLQDDGQVVILALVTVAAIASLAAIAGELGVVKDLHGIEREGHVALVLLTVMSSWAFIQVMFALHYAH